MQLATNKCSPNYVEPNDDSKLFDSVRDAAQFVISLALESRANVVFSLSYEELLDRKLSKYTHKVFLQPGQVWGILIVTIFFVYKVMIIHILIRRFIFMILLQIVADLRVRIRINEGTDLSLLELYPFTNDVYSGKWHDGIHFRACKDHTLRLTTTN